jgi:TadE-like protein
VGRLQWDLRTDASPHSDCRSAGAWTVERTLSEAVTRCIARCHAQGDLKGASGIVHWYYPSPRIPASGANLNLKLIEFGPRRARGQSLVEFALVFPVLMILVGGIIQFGIIFWGQNTLTQVARDIGRWAATQSSSPCSSTPSIATTVDSIASSSSLIGYSAGLWGGSNVTVYADNAGLPATAPSSEGVELAWTGSPSPCPPVDNTGLWYVTIRASHRVPIFFPLIPGNGNLTTSTQFRVEPAP